MKLVQEIGEIRMKLGEKRILKRISLRSEIMGGQMI